MSNEPEAIETQNEPPPLPKATSIRPERSRLVPPLSEPEEWQSIVQSSKKRKQRSGNIASTSTVDGATFVEFSDDHGAETIGQHNTAELLEEVNQRPLPCSACGSPRPIGAKFCVACGLPFDDQPVLKSATTTSPNSTAPETLATSSSTTTFHCQNCGSDIATSAGQRTYRCPFCDSTYVAEIDFKTSDRRRPEFVIGFTVTREQAIEKYMAWIQKKSWFRPGDLSLRAISEKQMGVYIPFWHYAYAARSRWNALIGQYWYRTETYTVRVNGKTETRTRTVRETEWNPLSGRHHKYYFGYMVSASKGLTQQEALSIQPYDLRAITRYKPYYLAGWLSEEYSIDYVQAKVIAEDEFQKREYNSVSRLMPGDTYSRLQVSTEFELNEIDLVYLPVHVLSYRYRDRVYRFLVNGQTGRFAGEKPVSGVRIAVAITLLLLLIAAVVLIVLFLQNR